MRFLAIKHPGDGLVFVRRECRDINVRLHTLVA
jgi:hypothetical protein